MRAPSQSRRARSAICGPLVAFRSGIIPPVRAAVRGASRPAPGLWRRLRGPPRSACRPRWPSTITPGSSTESGTSCTTGSPRGRGTPAGGRDIRSCSSTRRGSPTRPRSCTMRRWAFLSVPGAYQLLLWVAYLAPGVTVFALLARVTGNGWCALPGAFVALTLSAGVASGVEGGVHWGMVSGPPGLGSPAAPAPRPHPLDRGRSPAAVRPGAADRGARAHPPHAPADGGRDRARRRARVQVRTAAPAWSAAAARPGASAAALTAFWTLPLLARLPHTRALAWGSLGTGPASALARPLPLILIALAVLAYRPAGGGAAARGPRPSSPACRGSSPS